MKAIHALLTATLLGCAGCGRTGPGFSDAGTAFGGCVERAKACERDAVKGCCPRACLNAYRRALNHGASEAAAYRNIFTPKASCAVVSLVDKR